MDFDPTEFLAQHMSEDQNAIYTAPDMNESPIVPDNVQVEGGLQMEQDVQIPVPVFDTLNLPSEEQEDIIEINPNDTEEESLDETVFADSITAVSDDLVVSQQASPTDRTSSPHVRRVIATSPGETSFRKEFYCGNYERVKLFRLHCTTCDLHLGFAPWLTERQMRMHKLLNVAICRRCFDFYGDIHFPIQDGTEIYCCWCGEGGEVFCCSQCPKIVCKKCVIRNFGRSKVDEIQENDDWKCFVCEPSAIWPHRALFMGLQRLGKETRQKVAPLDKDQRIALLSQDKSHCCLKMNEQVPEISLPRKSIMSKIPLCLIANVHLAAVKNQPDLPIPRNSFINSASYMNSNNTYQRFNPSNQMTTNQMIPVQQIRVLKPSSNMNTFMSQNMNRVMMQNRIRSQSPRPNVNTNQQLVARNQQRQYRAVPYLSSNRQPRPVAPLLHAPSRAIRSVTPIRHNQQMGPAKPLQHGEVIDLVEDSADSPGKANQYRAKKQPSSPSYDLSYLEKGVKDIIGALSPLTLIMDNFALSREDLQQDLTKLTNYSEKLTHNIKVAICSLAKINQDIMDASKCAIDNKVSKVVRDIQMNGLSMSSRSSFEQHSVLPGRSNMNISATITTPTNTPVNASPKPSNRKPSVQTQSKRGLDESESGEEEFNPLLLCCEAVIQEGGNKI